MNVLDIIIIVIMLWAVISGLRQGIIAKAFGLAGIILGVWLAFRFSSKLGEWLGFSLSNTAAFVILIVVAILVMIVVGRVAKHIMKLTGLGFIDRLGGAVISLAEYALLTGLLLGLFENINSRTGWVEKEKTDSSVLSAPITRFSEMVFPYVLTAKDSLLEGLHIDKPDQSDPSTAPSTHKL